MGGMHFSKCPLIRLQFGIIELQECSPLLNYSDVLIGFASECDKRSAEFERRLSSR